MAVRILIPQRITLQADCDCMACGCPLMAGEIAHVAGNVVGCSSMCCLDAAEAEEDRSELLAYRVAFDAEPCRA